MQSASLPLVLSLSTTRPIATGFPWLCNAQRAVAPGSKALRDLGRGPQATMRSAALSPRHARRTPCAAGCTPKARSPRFEAGRLPGLVRASLARRCHRCALSCRLLLSSPRSPDSRAATTSRRRMGRAARTSFAAAPPRLRASTPHRRRAARRQAARRMRRARSERSSRPRLPRGSTTRSTPRAPPSPPAGVSRPTERGGR